VTTPPEKAPLYADIAATLRHEIGAGLYLPGERLPPEAQLATRFGVNRHTLRAAMARLAAEGLVHARRGAGVFVASRPTDYALGRRVRFHQNVAASGRTPSRDSLYIETRHAEAREAEALGLAPGAVVHVFGGLSLVDGTPIAAFRSVFPAARLAGLPAHLAATGSVTQALAATGVADYTRASTRLTAKAAHGALAARLRLPEGAPILRSISVNVDGTGVPVEYGHTWFAGERVTLTHSPED
jgi:GntR family phosphonate transport system transcriptional regulator